jgi:hypothetical protein
VQGIEGILKQVPNSKIKKPSSTDRTGDQPSILQYTSPANFSFGSAFPAKRSASEVEGPFDHLPCTPKGYQQAETKCWQQYKAILVCPHCKQALGRRGSLKGAAGNPDSKGVRRTSVECHLLISASRKHSFRLLEGLECTPGASGAAAALRELHQRLPGRPDDRTSSKITSQTPASDKLAVKKSPAAIAEDLEILRPSTPPTIHITKKPRHIPQDMAPPKGQLSQEDVLRLIQDQLTPIKAGMGNFEALTARLDHLEALNRKAQETIEALQATIDDQREENARLRAQLAAARKTRPVDPNEPDHGDNGPPRVPQPTMAQVQPRGRGRAPSARRPSRARAPPQPAGTPGLGQAQATEDGELPGDTWARVVRRKARTTPTLLSRPQEEVRAMFENREPADAQRAELNLPDDTRLDSIYMQIPPKLRPMRSEGQHHKKLRHALCSIGIDNSHICEISFIGRSIAHLLVPAAHVETVSQTLRGAPGGSVLLANFDPLAVPQNMTDAFHRHVDTRKTCIQRLSTLVVRQRSPAFVLGTLASAPAVVLPELMAKIRQRAEGLQLSARWLRILDWAHASLTRPAQAAGAPSIDDDMVENE